VKYDRIAVINDKAYNKLVYVSTLYARYSVRFIRQNYTDIMLEFSSLPINLWESLIVLCNSRQVIARSRWCLSRPVREPMDGCKFLPLYASTLLLDRVSQKLLENKIKQRLVNFDPFVFFSFILILHFFKHIIYSCLQKNLHKSRSESESSNRDTFRPC
jgi:hypothetical protein